MVPNYRSKETMVIVDGDGPVDPVTAPIYAFFRHRQTRVLCAQTPAETISIIAATSYPVAGPTSRRRGLCVSAMRQIDSNRAHSSYLLVRSRSRAYRLNYRSTYRR